MSKHVKLNYADAKRQLFETIYAIERELITQYKMSEDTAACISEGLVQSDVWIALDSALVVFQQLTDKE
jgi:hypothetical protein